MADTDDAAASFDGALAFSIDGFCHASSLGRSYVYESIAAGKLRTVKLGRRRLILAEDARAFLRGETGREA